ncbi:hypothetical protein CWE12_07015 [Aliidiomarina sedimenti]|uniref:Uncharacterized protein n=1 Tax=Aliidiomarina sedimenti TaxID=1933879 RepID=A0ABY0BY82_9GAMM|nr:hypothetical protein [Aliidiomarina sedimenti]RUO29715.1 hypothetical protein CWE12_07015 [Aliidiomarina sedimenti]
MEVETKQASFISALSRWRDSCLFYFKFDMVLIAAVAAIVSFFKIEGEAVLGLAADHKVALHYLIALLIYALLFEAAITNTCNRPNLSAVLSNERNKFWLYLGFKWAYVFQVIAHAGLLIFSLGYATGYVESFMR